jgi:hypothetical protein
VSRAAGVRVEYAALPGRVRAWVEAELRSQVTSAVTQAGGFSPGAAARVVTASGGRAFVKAVGPELNPKTPELFRMERWLWSRCPHHLMRRSCWPPTTTVTGWPCCSRTSKVGCRTPVDQRGCGSGLRRIGRAHRGAASLALAAAPRAEVTMAGFLTRWPLVRRSPPFDLDPWAGRHLDALVGLGERALRAIRGDTLTHWDVRSDNGWSRPKTGWSSSTGRTPAGPLNG